MKVVIFCGGFGMRLREFSDTIPKPMVTIGYRPILWHLMKYYAHYGHKEFILCLGYRADAIKDYFLNYSECLTNDFVLAGGGKNVEMLATDIHDWRITFVDTGITSNIGQRLKKVEKYLEGEPMFMANYADGLTDMPLSEYIDNFQRQNKIATFICVKPSQTFHVVSTDMEDEVTSIHHVTDSNLWMNGGYFLFKNDIFRYLRNGEELVVEPFQRLIAQRQLSAYKYSGFWACMDTFKEKQQLDDLFNRGNAPWEVWKQNSNILMESACLA
jgi:glucose-1-phosphate cytidylyltransferase